MRHQFEEWYMSTFKQALIGELAYSIELGYVHDTVNMLWMGFQAGVASEKANV